MQSTPPHMFAGAHSTNASHSTFNAASRDINMYVNNSANENEILATLKPVERIGHAHGCMEGTRKDVLQDIYNWLDDFSESVPNILLLTGSPGAGKSTIAATVVSNLYRRQRLGSSFPFNHSDTSLSDPNAVWRTVAFDLARFHPGMKGNLVEVLKGADPGIADITMQFERLIEGPLRENHNELSSRPPVVVLDALDECDSSRTQLDQRRRLIQTFMLWNNLPRKFKLIVTSRDERLPDPFCKLCLPIVLQTGVRVSPESADDIRLFLQKRFADIVEDYPSLSDWPGESKIERLTEGAAGLFIWAETLARFVGNEKGSPDKQLELVLRGDLGAEGGTISGLYRRILDVSFGDSTTYMLDAFNAVVGTIVFAKVPLRRDDLMRFLNAPITESTIDLILNKLSSVISIGKADRVIHVCHLSFIDFICDAARSPKHFIDRAMHNRSLASICFRLMRVGLKFNICNLETSHLRNDDVPGLADRIQKSIPTHLSYACRFGWQHLRDTDIPSERSAIAELMNDIDTFLHVQLLYWLEVMSLIKQVSNALAGLQFMTRWIQVLDTDLAAFAADATRFIVNFAAPISESAPHVYISTLSWSPRKSKVARHFLPHFPHTLSIATGQESDWPALVNLLEGHTSKVNSVAFSPGGKRVVSGSYDKTIRIWDAETGEVVAGPFAGHTDQVTSVGFSPDEKRVVSGSSDKTIRIWDAETGEIIADPFEGHTDGVTSVGFSPDGKHVVSGSSDQTIRVWNVEIVVVLSGPFEGHTDGVTSVGFSPDGKRVVSGSLDQTIRVWNVETGAVLSGPFEGHTSSVTSVGFSPDGKCVVSGSWDQTIRIWEAETGEVITISGPLEGHTSFVNSVGFSPDGKRVVSGWVNNRIRIWDTETGEVLSGPFEGHTSAVDSAGFSPDRKRVVSGSWDKTIRIWDRETGEVIAGPFDGHTSNVSSVGFSPDGKRIVSGSWDKTIRLWDAETGSYDNTNRIWDAETDEVISGLFEGHTAGVTSVGSSPDGKRIVSASEDKIVRIWDAETGEIIAGPFEGHADRVTSVIFSPDGKHVVSASEDKTIRIWDVERSDILASPLKGHTNHVTSVGFSSDGQRIVSGSWDKTIRIWNAETGEVIAGPFEGHTGLIASVGFSLDGERVVSGSSDKTIRIWDAETGEVIAGPFEGHTQWVNSVGFSPDGKHIVSGSGDKTIRIWKADTGEVIAGPVEGHTSWVTSVGFSPDGKRVVSGSDDKTIRISDAQTGEVIAGPFEGHTDFVVSVAFSPDGKRIISGSWDKTIRIWQAETDKVIAGPFEGNREFQTCHLDFNTGWVKTHDGRGLLFWVPVTHRARLCGTDTILIIGGNTTRVDLRAFVHGPCWAQCHESTSDGKGRDKLEGDNAKQKTVDFTTATAAEKVPIRGRAMSNTASKLKERQDASTSAPRRHAIATPTNASAKTLSCEYRKPASPSTPPSLFGTNKVKAEGSSSTSAAKPSLPKSTSRSSSTLRPGPRPTPSSTSPSSSSSRPAASSSSRTKPTTPLPSTSRQRTTTKERKPGWR